MHVIERIVNVVQQCMDRGWGGWAADVYQNMCFWNFPFAELRLKDFNILWSFFPSSLPWRHGERDGKAPEITLVIIQHHNSHNYT